MCLRTFVPAAQVLVKPLNEQKARTPKGVRAFWRAQEGTGFRYRETGGRTLRVLTNLRTFGAVSRHSPVRAKYPRLWAGVFWRAQEGTGFRYRETGGRTLRVLTNLRACGTGSRQAPE